MLLRQIPDPKLAQYAYLVGCQATGEALLVDPERDIDRYVAAAEAEGLEITAVAETHIHADFLSGAREFAERFGTRVYLSAEGGPDWSYGWVHGSRRDGEPYEVVLLRDGDEFDIGRIRIRALHTPGHTPEHLSYLVVDRGAGASTPMGIASGDFVFVGDLGRPDLLEQAAGMAGVQEDSARTLFRSLPVFTRLDDHLQVWPGHGAGSSCGKALGAVPTTTVGYEKRYNASLAVAERGEDEFVDAILSGQPEPQTYFARMKRENRDGPPLLGRLPSPVRLSLGELERLQDEATEGVDAPLVVDTRVDRSGFMARHLPGSLYAPMDRAFNTVVGSLVVDASRPLVLVVEADRLQEAVQDLVRIGYDHVVGFVEPETLERYFEEGGASESIDEIDFSSVAAALDAPDITVLDVRFASEYDAGHIPAAVNASYTRLPEYLEERVPSGRTLLVHCATGARASAAAAWLSARGRSVRLVNAPWTAWVGAGEPVERRKIPCSS